MDRSHQIYEELLNLPFINVIKVDILDKEVHIYCCSNLQETICTGCLKKSKIVNQTYTRKIRDLDLLGRKVYLYLETRQFLCKNCNKYFTESFSFVGKNGQVTKRQEKWIFEMCRKQSVQEVAALVDMGYAQVESIYYRYANNLIDEVEGYKQVKKLGIDEFALKKGHKNFACILVDLDKHEIIDILEKRDKAFLMSHLSSKGVDFLNQIEVFSCDMWKPYSTLAASLFPNALIVIDRFHWMKYLNKAVDKQRKALRKEDMDEPAFKNIKWLLLKNRNKLNEEQKQELESVFKKSPELEQVYFLKCSFQDIFDCNFSKGFAHKQIKYWLKCAKEINNQYLNEFVKVFNNWQDYILNYFEGKFSNGVVEGFNNSIKAIKRQAYGMLNFDRFKARILASFYS